MTPTVIGIIGNTQGVSNAMSPPMKQNRNSDTSEAPSLLPCDRSPQLPTNLAALISGRLE